MGQWYFASDSVQSWMQKNCSRVSLMLSEVQLSKVHSLTWGIFAEQLSLATKHLIAVFTMYIYTPCVHQWSAIVVLTHVGDITYYITAHHKVLRNWEQTVLTRLLFSSTCKK